MSLNGIDAEKAAFQSGSDSSNNSLELSPAVSSIDYEVTIQYKNCTWVQAAGLLFSEYICLAIMSFPWSYSILGLVPGIILTVFVALTTMYTGFTITEFCIENPGITSIMDIGQRLFWNSRWAWWFTALCFVANNTLIQALHVLVGAEFFNTEIRNFPGGEINTCSIVFSVVSMVICTIISLPRTFHQMSWLGYFSAATMFAAVILSMAFAGTQRHPNKWDGTPVQWHLWPLPGTTFGDGVSAFLNITYTLVGQITYPSFISQMKKPRDFKKALVAVTVAEIVVFVVVGSIIYVYVGNEYMSSPAFGTLTGTGKRIAFGFAAPTIFYLGSLYSNVTSQFLLQFVFRPDSRHRNSHTLSGWAVWTGINAGLWVLAFVIAEVIPFFSDLLSLMSSAFDCSFGFIYWGQAWLIMRARSRGKAGKSMSRVCDWWDDFVTSSVWIKAEYIASIGLYITGGFILGPGLYAAVDSIVLNYESRLYGNPFSCKSTAI